MRSIRAEDNAMLGRRAMLAGLAAIPARGAMAAPLRRVRPGDPAWPAESDWAALRERVAGNLIAVRSPLDTCRADPQGEACQALFRELKNPYFIGDDPALTQTCGWVDAWVSQPSVHAVAARDGRHVAAAVDFARDRNLRLVIRGGAHSYLGTSCAPDSLMIWTRAMDAITVHDAFVPRGTTAPPVPAVTLGAGAIWMHAYDAVTTGQGRYVQGGGCGTVGVAGLVQGGGFGSYSRAFGTAGASLLEAEIVTADGAIRVVNAVQEPDLFWALKGGGAGTFGVVTRMTLRCWDLPAEFGVVSLGVRAKSATAFRRLVAAFIAHYARNLCTPHWGELARVMRGGRLEIGMNFQGLSEDAARGLWQRFFDDVAADDELVATRPLVLAGPGRHRWDGEALARMFPAIVRFDDRPGAPRRNFFWTANSAEAGHVIHDFESLWMPADLLRPERQAALADALVAAAGHADVEMHFQKGLAGASPAVIAAARDTPMNPDVAEAFMLAILGSEGPPAFPGIAGHEPDVAAARRDAARIAQAVAELRKVAPGTGAYVAESSYFQPDWQRAYWGANYPRLLAVKRRYDPDGLFFVRHGVGSEEWSEDGFTRSA
jgi:FAD/FMN-containing dehydrogenase